ncbi:hypothetical protein [Lacticaseibacillus saniviri]|uniref:Uncharacterized protein n=1 Tax=Lacticaseibacillus saniviri JCM 17471 = DSM 24301 TaxID=1293598 RepID=A0A0R2MSU1_9LACO|nr:hypothetical protein [Lacticaseibacillus saniviri]KRO15884.1 hypothetical protein IV56_GL002074 [Lacticaseibacillus saniviri JCM 17471 = DSM 24301]
MEWTDEQKIVLNFIAKEYDAGRNIFDVYFTLFAGARGEGIELIPAKVKAAFNSLSIEEMNRVGSYGAIPF